MLASVMVAWGHGEGSFSEVVHWGQARCHESSRMISTRILKYIAFGSMGPGGSFLILGMCRVGPTRPEASLCQQKRTLSSPVQLVKAKNLSRQV